MPSSGFCDNFYCGHEEKCAKNLSKTYNISLKRALWRSLAASS